MSASSYDLTTGRILPRLIKVAIPIMGTELMSMTYNLADMFWIGRIGADALAATATAGLYMWLSVAFMLIGSVGAGIGVSQSMGRNDEEAARRYAQNAVLIAAGLGVMFGAVMVFFRTPMVAFFGFTSPFVISSAETYLMIVGLAVPFTYVSSVITGTFNASGNSRVPFLLNSCGVVLNILLDPILIFVLDLGVAGAAIATVSSQILVFGLLLAAMKKSRQRPFVDFAIIRKPDIAVIRQLFAWTIPVCLESMFFTLLVIVTSRFEASFGEDAVAMSRVGSQIESLTWLVGGGFGSALTAFVGQNYGAGKQARIDLGMRFSLAAMSVYGLFVTALLVFAGRYIFAAFLPVPELVERSVLYLRILAICQVPMCVQTVVASTFKGTGRTIPPSVVNTASNLLRVVMVYLLSRTSLGLTGIWLSVSLTASLKGVWIVVWYALAERKRKAAMAA